MFHYFIPGATKEQVAPGDKLDHAFLKSVGLGDVLADLASVPADATVICRKGPLSDGPGGGSGTLIAPTRKYDSGPVVLCDANLQAWKAGPGGKFFLGYLKSERPGPRSLERKELIGGTEIADDSGNVWAVPIARAPQWNRPFGALPQSYTFDEQGQPVPQLLPQFAWLWDLSGEIRDWYRLADAATNDGAEPDGEAVAGDAPPAEKPELPAFGRLVQYAARLLGVNYRLGFPELTALSAAGAVVLTDRTVHAICQASFGWQILEEAKKKPPGSDSNQAASSSSSTTGDGIPIGAPGTGRVEERSPRP